MRSVLVAFNEPKLLRTISKNVQKNGAEDIVFTVKTTKASFLDEVASGNYDSAIIMEQIGREPWTIPEMVQIADSYNINLIPIISENHKGTRDITALSSVGITSAVFIRKGGVYKADEILRMIEHPRTLKEARTYYGIETYADQKSGDLSMASESKIADAIDCLNANRDSDALGDVLIQILVQYKFDLAQAAELLERLDKDMTLRLQKTVEYYDLLGDLKKHDLVANYRIPREIRKLKKSQGKTGSKTQEVIHEDTAVSDEKSLSEEEPVVVMPSAIIEDIPEDKIRMVDEPVISDIDIDADYEEEEENFDPEEYEEDYGFDGEQNDMDLDEEDYTLSEPEPIAETSAAPGMGDMDWDDDFSFDEQLTVSSDIPQVLKEESNEEKEPVKKSAGELKKERKNEMKTKLKEQKLEEEMEEEKSGPNFMLIGIMAGLVLFMIVLAVLFIKISIDRANKQARANYESGYNTTYATDDAATYEINENGSPILKDENGNIIYDGSMPETAPADQEEMDIAIVTEEDNNTVQQEFNDPSGFEEGVSYKGLDIVNLINGNQGADCTLQLKNGATVEVRRGNASIEDFKPSGTYQCQKTEDGGLIITEK